MNQLALPVAPQDALLTFDRLAPGMLIGTMAMSVDADMLSQWEALYGPRPASDMLPLAFAPLLLMRAMLTIASPRPPGNIHVEQTYNIERMPRLGDSLIAAVSCCAKEIRKERRIVELEVMLSDKSDTTPMFSGRSTLFWAQ